MTAKYLQNVKPSPLVTPEVLGAVSKVESDNNPNAVGPLTKHGSALGQYQILPSTARDMGVDPMNPEQARQGAHNYLNWLVGETGDLKSALEAYNTGLGNWKKNRSNLPKETADYVKRVMGLLTKHEQGLPPPTVASAPLNPQAPKEEKDTEKDRAPPPEQVASLAPGPGPSPQFQGYGKISNPPSQFMGKNNPISMVQALLQDPTSLSRGEGRANMAGGGLVKKMLSLSKNFAKNDISPEEMEALWRYQGPAYVNSVLRGLDNSATYNKSLHGTGNLDLAVEDINRIDELFKRAPKVEEPITTLRMSRKGAYPTTKEPAYLSTTPSPRAMRGMFPGNSATSGDLHKIQVPEGTPFLMPFLNDDPRHFENAFEKELILPRGGRLTRGGEGGALGYSTPSPGEKDILSDPEALRAQLDRLRGRRYAGGGAVIRSAPRNRILGALSDLVNGADEHVLKPVQEYAEKTPGVNEALSAGLGLPLVYQYLTGDKPKPLSWLVPRLNSLGGVLEDASYGMPLTTGKGMTTGLKPEVGFAALDAAQLPSMGRGAASIGRGIKPLAAKILSKRAAPGVVESMFGPEAEWKAARKAWDSAQGFAGGGAVRGALGRIARMLGGDEVPAKLLPLQAVKEQGGQWLPGSAKEFVQGPTPWPDHLKKPHEEWAEKAIPKYIERYMGAKGDPLANVRIPHGQGMKRWEDLTDPVIKSTTAGAARSNSYRNFKTPEWMEKLPPEAPMYGVEPGSHASVQDYISHALDHAATIPPEKLQQYDFPRLVQEVQKIDAERAKKMATVEGRAEGTTKFKEYPTGFHWAEVQSPEALKREGDIMGHCVGGYCDDVKSGAKKIYSLRDPKGESHATVEVSQDIPSTKDVEEYLRSGKVGEGAFPTQINQIKGKQNLAPKPEYQQYIQDFIRTGKYGDVRDLQNSGLQPVKNLDRVKYPTGELSSDVVKALQEKHGDYISPKEIEDYLKSTPPGIPQMRRGGAVKKACRGGVTCPCIKCSRKRFEHRA